MTDNTTENPVQADINDVLDNLTTQHASQARQLAISQAQAMSLQRDVATLQRRLAELEAKQAENK